MEEGAPRKKNGFVTVKLLVHLPKTYTLRKYYDFDLYYQNCST